MPKATITAIAVALCLAAVASAAPTQDFSHRRSTRRSYTSGYNSGAYNSGAYSSGGGPKPTTGGIVFKTTVSLQGVTAAQFTGAVQDKFKASVVAGLMHMPTIKAGNAPLTANEVYIDSYTNTRRSGLSVTFSIYTGSTNTAMVQSAMASLVNHLDDTSATGFQSVMNAMCTVAGLNFTITDMSVTSQPAITYTPPATASSSDDDNTTLIIVIVIIVVVVAVAAYFVCQNQSHKPTSDVTIYRDQDGNEALGKKGQIPTMGSSPMDDKTITL